MVVVVRTTLEDMSVFPSVCTVARNSGDLNQPSGEAKGGEARPPLHQLLRSQGEPTFSIALTLEALDRACHAQES